VELASLLSVHFSQVEACAQALVKGDRELHLVLGQLITSRYLEELCRQVNERLVSCGLLHLPSLTKELDLPAEFLVEQVHARLGSIIEGFKDPGDPRTLLTPSYMSRSRARVRGILSACTTPTPLHTLVAREGMQEKLFLSLAEELIRTGRLPGQISGGKSASKAVYTPHSYAKAQATWVEDFLASNQYLEYDAVGRLGIQDPKQFILKKYPEAGLVFLDSCCLGPGLVSQLEVSLEECLSSGGALDSLSVLPSVVSPEDGAMLVQQVMAARKGSSSQALVLGESTVVSGGLVATILQSFDDKMHVRAAEDVESGAVAQSLVEQGCEDEEAGTGHADRKEERRKKAAGGSAGGGAQGRQTKTKSVKKKGGKKKDDDWSDEDEGGKGKSGSKVAKASAKSKELEFISPPDLDAILREVPQLNDCVDEVFEELTAHIISILNSKYREIARERYQSSLVASMQNKRRSHAELEEKMNSIFTMIRLGEKGINEFSSEENQSGLARYLLKTSGTEMVNEMLLFVAEENMIKVDQNKELTNEMKLKIIGQLPKEISEPALKIHKAVGGSSVSEFISVLEGNISSLCSVLLKKADKKKDRQILFGHRQSLLEQLSQCCDPALGLHLAVLTLFQHCSGHILQASGKFVPAIIEHLAVQGGKLKSEQLDHLTHLQRLVVSRMGKEDMEAELEQNLLDSLEKVKQLVQDFKKGNSAE